MRTTQELHTPQLHTPPGDYLDFVHVCVQIPGADCRATLKDVARYVSVLLCRGALQSASVEKHQVHLTVYMTARSLWRAHLWHSLAYQLKETV